MNILDLIKKKSQSEAAMARQAVQRVKSFVQKYPTPASYAAPKVKEYFKPAPQVRARDFVREVPNFFPKVASKITPETILDYSIRPATRGATSMIKTFTGDKSVINPTTIPEKVFYGNRPVGDIYTSGEQTARDFGMKNKPTSPLGMAGLGVLGGTVASLDVFTGGGKKKIAQALASEGTEVGIKRILGNTAKNYSDDVIRTIAKERNPALIENIISAKKSPLIQEARKYPKLSNPERQAVESSASMKAYINDPTPLGKGVEIHEATERPIYFDTPRGSSGKLPAGHTQALDAEIGYYKSLVPELNKYKTSEIDNVVVKRLQEKYGKGVYGNELSAPIPFKAKNATEQEIYNLVKNKLESHPPQEGVVKTPPAGLSIKAVSPQEAQVIKNTYLTPKGNSDNELIQTLNRALKEAKPLRGQQEALYSEARSQKMAKMMGARGKMAGEKGFFQEKGALSGSLPKVEFESIRKNFTQDNVDRLFNMVKENKNISEWDKIAAQEGLFKILGEKGGGVPTRNEIAKMHQVFGSEFTETLLSKRPFFEKAKEFGMQMYNLPRSLMAGVGDFSATFMQNALFAYRHPVMTAKNFGKSLKYFGSETYHKASMQEIAQRPNYKIMKDAKVSFTETGPIVTQREEEFMAPIAEKIPGLGKVIKATGRAYSGFLNKMRADVADSLIETQKILGEPLDGRFLKSMGEFVNMGTGRGSLGKLEKASSVLAQGMFSARKLMATFNTLNPVFYVKASPLIRREALKTMGAFFGGSATITGLAKMAGADVSTDPTNSDFGKIKIGNTRVNLFGTYQQLAVLLARQMKGYATSSTTGRRMTLNDGYKPLTRLQLAGRFFQSKEHPTLSYLTGAMEGQNTIGEKFDYSTEALRRMMPMIISDAYDLQKEHGNKGLLGVIPAMLGIFTQTYGSQVPNIEKTEAGNPTIKLKNIPDVSEMIMNKIRGTQSSNIPLEQQQGLVEQKRREQDLDYQKEQIKKGHAGDMDAVDMNDPAIKSYLQKIEKEKSKENLLNDLQSGGGIESINKYPKGTLTTSMINDLYENGDIDDTTKLKLDNKVKLQARASKVKYAKSLIDQDINNVKDMVNQGALTPDIVDDMFGTGVITGKQALAFQKYIERNKWETGQKKKVTAKTYNKYIQEWTAKYGTNKKPQIITKQPKQYAPIYTGKPYYKP